MVAGTWRSRLTRRGVGRGLVVNGHWSDCVVPSYMFSATYFGLMYIDR